MKKKLESELVSIAHRILKLKGKEDVIKMHSEAGQLYEKLAVLKFAYENFEQGVMPTIGIDSSFFGMLDDAFNNKISDNIEREDRLYVNLDEIEDDGIMEPVMEKIKDMVAQMPQEAQAIDLFFDQPSSKAHHSKHDLDDITADFKNIPVFDPVSTSQHALNDDIKKPVSLNDRLKTGGLNIGLNDKIAFIKHLFEGSREDYDRVLSQISTSSSYDEAHNLVQNIVKPDYNNWKGKEEFEGRFMEIIESKFS